MPATRTWRLMGLELPVGASEAGLRARACRTLGLEPAELSGFRIARKALDARGRGRGRGLRFVVHVDVVLDAGCKTSRLTRLQRSGRVVEAPLPALLVAPGRHASLGSLLESESASRRVVVVGAGPAGLFCAMVLARNGVPVTVLDRGSSLDRRGREVVAFHRTRTPNPESNLLFGEGGAGTYSDGKIYTRVDDPLEVPLLEELVRAGAPPDILYDSRSHIGTDRLHRILPVLREHMQELGVRFAWNTRLDGLVQSGSPGDPDRRVIAVRTNAGEIGCEALFLAPGHSARDTWSMLLEHGVALEAKPFQLGIRVEHPQELVDAGRHGTGPEAELLGAASYQLVCKAGEGLPAVHTFCMCPGGRIVASVNEPGYLCTNGMSNSRHSSRWANAAIVTTFGPEHFGEGPLAGVELQRALEARFFEGGGADYTAPTQRVPDFLHGRTSREAGPTSYRLGTRPGRLDELLPDFARDALRRGIDRFDRMLPGFAGETGLLVGLESRSAGPVRLPREPDARLARGYTNLYPIGEGAGHAGGIMSAAIDGARAALSLVQHGLRR